MEVQSINFRITEWLRRKEPRSILQLDNMMLSNIPTDILSLKGIKRLRLNNNFLSHLPKNFNILSDLEELYLENNDFSDFPEVIFDLPKLRYLDLGNNNIENITDNFNSSHKLTELYLYKNKLKTIPFTIGQIKDLTVLDLCNNHLTNLPISLIKIQRLIESVTTHPTVRGGIYVENNPFTNIELINLSKLPQPEQTIAIFKFLQQETDTVNSNTANIITTEEQQKPKWWKSKKNYLVFLILILILALTTYQPLWVWGIISLIFGSVFWVLFTETFKKIPQIDTMTKFFANFLGSNEPYKEKILKLKNRFNRK